VFGVGVGVGDEEKIINYVYSCIVQDGHVHKYHTAAHLIHSGITETSHYKKISVGATIEKYSFFHICRM